MRYRHNKWTFYTFSTSWKPVALNMRLQLSRIPWENSRIRFNFSSLFSDKGNIKHCWFWNMEFSLSLIFLKRTTKYAFSYNLHQKSMKIGSASSHFINTIEKKIRVIGLETTFIEKLIYDAFNLLSRCRWEGYIIHRISLLWSINFPLSGLRLVFSHENV